MNKPIFIKFVVISFILIFAGCYAPSPPPHAPSSNIWHKITVYVDSTGDHVVPRSELHNFQKDEVYTLGLDINNGGSLIQLSIWDVPKQSIFFPQGEPRDYHNLNSGNVSRLTIIGTADNTPVVKKVVVSWFIILEVITRDEPNSINYKVEAVDIRGKKHSGYLYPEQLPRTLMLGDPETNLYR